MAWQRSGRHEPYPAGHRERGAALDVLRPWIYPHTSRQGWFAHPGGRACAFHPSFHGPLSKLATGRAPWTLPSVAPGLLRGEPRTSRRNFLRRSRASTGTRGDGSSSGMGQRYSPKRCRHAGDHGSPKTVRHTPAIAATKSSTALAARLQTGVRPGIAPAQVSVSMRLLGHIWIGAAHFRRNNCASTRIRI